MPKSPKDLRELMAQLNRADVADLVGVVGPLGAFAAPIPGGGQSLVFSLEPWRPVIGAVQERKLTLRAEMSEAELRSALSIVKALDVVRIRARVAQETTFGTPQGLLVEIVTVKYDGDAELSQRAAKLGQPVRVKDDRFGLLTLDRRFNWFEIETTWMSQDVKLCLSMDDCDDVARLLGLAYMLWDAQAKWDRAVRDCAVLSLLDLKNENWRDDDEEEVTAEDFAARIAPQEIVLHHTGRFTFWCDDDDLFAGHVIGVVGNLFDGAQSADIHG